MIVIGTNNGMYSSNINNNLKNPYSWTKIVQNFNEVVTSISNNSEFLLFTTSNGLYKYYFTSGEFVNVDLQISTNNANNIYIIDNEYWFSDDKLIYFYIFRQIIPEINKAFT